MEYIGKREDWNKSGIYQISNRINDRVYIGSTKNLRDRYRHHKRQLIKGNNPSLLLQRFCSKYGINTLIFSVLEIVEENKLLEREEYYLNLLNCKFNAMLTPQRQCGYKHTESTIEKMSKIAKDSFSKGRIIWNKGKKLSEEQKQSFKQCSKGVPRIKNRTPVCLYDFDGITLIKCYESASEAVKETRIRMSSIFSNINGRYKTTKAGIWKRN